MVCEHRVEHLSQRKAASQDAPRTGEQGLEQSVAETRQDDQTVPAHLLITQGQECADVGASGSRNGQWRGTACPLSLEGS